MQTLPSELSHRILSMLSYQQLASAATVCRSWRGLTSQEELWRSLYVERWGQDKAGSVALILSHGNAWKAAYEVQDRCHRIGMRFTITREGNRIYTAENGLLLRCLAYLDGNSLDMKSNTHTVVQSNISMDAFPGLCKKQRREMNPSPGMLDKLLEFIADVQHSQNNNPRITQV